MRWKDFFSFKRVQVNHNLFYSSASTSKSMNINRLVTCQLVYLVRLMYTVKEHLGRETLSCVCDEALHYNCTWTGDLVIYSCYLFIGWKSYCVIVIPNVLYALKGLFLQTTISLYYLRLPHCFSSTSFSFPMKDVGI